ncbi:MAG: hypothetical protein LBQ69_01730 [Treponema sp.]|nr:hypothetical protein [Treponema sp.]
MGDKFSAEITNAKPANFDSLAPEDVLTARMFDGGGHFNLGDSKGQFIWEPLEYNNSNNVRRGATDDLRYITSELSEMPSKRFDKSTFL